MVDDVEQGGDETPGPLMLGRLFLSITKGLSGVAGSGRSYNRTMNNTEKTVSHRILPSGHLYTILVPDSQIYIFWNNKTSLDTLFHLF